MIILLIPPPSPIGDHIAHSDKRSLICCCHWQFQSSLSPTVDLTHLDHHPGQLANWPRSMDLDAAAGIAFLGTTNMQWLIVFPLPHLCAQYPPTGTKLPRPEEQQLRRVLIYGAPKSSIHRTIHTSRHTSHRDVSLEPATYHTLQLAGDPRPETRNPGTQFL